MQLTDIFESSSCFISSKIKEEKKREKKENNTL